MNTIDNNKDKLFELYTLAELSYKEHFKDLVDDGEELFPMGWYGNKNYQEKIKIMSEAIKTNTLIVDTQAYLNILEGIEKNKNIL